MGFLKISEYSFANKLVVIHEVQTDLLNKLVNVVHRLNKANVEMTVHL